MVQGKHGTLATFQLIPLHNSRFASVLVTGWTSPDSLPDLWEVLGFSYVSFVLFLRILITGCGDNRGKKGGSFFVSFHSLLIFSKGKLARKGWRSHRTWQKAITQDSCRGWSLNLLSNSSIPVLFCAVQAVQVLIYTGHLCNLNQQDFMLSVVHCSPDEHFRISSVRPVTGFA